MTVLNEHRIGRRYLRGRPFHSDPAALSFAPDCHTVHSIELYGATARETEQGWYWYENGSSRGYFGPFATEREAMAHARNESR
jgi:hypothetical protein